MKSPPKSGFADSTPDFIALWILDEMRSSPFAPLLLRALYQVANIHQLAADASINRRCNVRKFPFLEFSPSTKSRTRRDASGDNFPNRLRSRICWAAWSIAVKAPSTVGNSREQSPSRKHSAKASSICLNSISKCSNRGLIICSVTCGSRFWRETNWLMQLTNICRCESKRLASAFRSPNIRLLF